MEGGAEVEGVLEGEHSSKLGENSRLTCADVEGRDGPETTDEGERVSAGERVNRDGAREERGGGGRR